MLPSVATLTSICEDACHSGQMEEYEVKPLNRQFVQEEFYQRMMDIHGGNTEQSILTTTNVKQLFRSSHLHVIHPSRTSLWYKLLHQDHLRNQHKFQQAIERYPEDIRNMFGRRNDISVRLPSCVDPNHLPSYHLNRRGQHAVTRILSIFAYYHPDITCAPLLGPITALFLHYMTEIDAYESLLILASNDFKVITQTEIQYQSLTHAFCALLRRHCRSTYDVLSKQSSQPSIFDDWLWIIFEYLPFHYLIPIIDCLLIEDMKILIRIAMSLYHFFVKYSLNQQGLMNKTRRRSSIFRRSKFLRSTRRSQTNLSIFSTPPKKSHINVREHFIAYIEHLDLPMEKFFKHAFGIHHLQRKVIFRTMEVGENLIDLKIREKGFD